MSVLLILPGFAGFQAVFPFKIGNALNGFSLLPREFEIDVLKFVVKTDLTGIRESCAEIHPINSRPVDGAHAHRTRSSVDVDITAFEHLRPFRNWVGRAFGPGNHLQHPVIVIRSHKVFRIETRACIHDGGHLGVINRNSGDKDPVLAPADDFTVLNDYRSERSSPAFFYRFVRESRRFVGELFFVFVAFNVLCAHRVLLRVLLGVCLGVCLGVLLRGVAGGAAESASFSLADARFIFADF